MRIATVDIGTNTVLLLVAERGADGSLHSVAERAVITRLGEGVDRTRRLSQAAVARTLECLGEYAAAIRAMHAEHVAVVGTSAMRDAAGGDELRAHARRLLGVDVRVLSGEEEARLTFRGSLGGLSIPAAGEVAVFDIGGGSTEVVSGVGDQPGRWVSLPFGAISLTERYLASNPVSPEEIQALKQEVSTAIMHRCAYMPARSPLLAGVGGTVSLLAALDLGLTEYEPSLLEGLPITPPRLQGLIARILSSTHEERRTWPIMGEGRADIVVAGVLAVGLLAERFPSSALVCSTQGLRYGLVRLAAEEARGGRAGNPLA